MPLTAKGEEIKHALQAEYGDTRGERILYAGKNRGTFTGIDDCVVAMDAACAAADRMAGRLRGKGSGRDR